MFNIFSGKPLSKLSFEELNSQERSTRIWYRWSVGFVFVMIFVVSFWTGMKGYHSTNLIFLSATCFLPAMAAAKLKKIKTEINSRV